MSNPPVHLVVGTPCYGGQVTTAYFNSILNLKRVCRPKGIALTVILPGEEALIGRARQDITAFFMGEPSATHLLFVDADIGFEPRQVFRLLDFDADVGAALYPLKKIDWERVTRLAMKGQPFLQAASLDYVFQVHEPPLMKDNFVRANYAGTGFLMIRRKTFEAMAARYPELRYQKTGRKPELFPGTAFQYTFFDCILDSKDGYLPEDYSFCRRWTEMGGEIWVDFESKLDHVGPVVFPGDMRSHPDVAGHLQVKPREKD